MFDIVLGSLAMLLLIAFFGWLAYSCLVFLVSSSVYGPFLTTIASAANVAELINTRHWHNRFVLSGVVVTLIMVLCSGFTEIAQWIFGFFEAPSEEELFSLSILAGGPVTLLIGSAFGHLARLHKEKLSCDEEWKYMAGVVESIESCDAGELAGSEKSLTTRVYSLELGAPYNVVYEAQEEFRRRVYGHLLRAVTQRLGKEFDR